MGELNRYPAVAQDPAEPTSDTVEMEIRKGVEEEEEDVKDQLPSVTESSAKASHESLTHGVVLTAITRKQENPFLTVSAEN